MSIYLIDLGMEDKALWRVESCFDFRREYMDVTHLMDADFLTMSMLEPRLQESEWDLVRNAKEILDSRIYTKLYCILDTEFLLELKTKLKIEGN